MGVWRWDVGRWDVGRWDVGRWGVGRWGVGALGVGRLGEACPVKTGRLLRPLFLSFSLWRRDVGTRASAPVSAPHPRSPRLAVSPFLRFPVSPGLDLVASSLHRFIGTTYNEAAFHRHEHPLHPGTTNPPRLIVSPVLHPLFLSFSLWRRDVDPDDRARPIHGATGYPAGSRNGTVAGRRAPQGVDLWPRVVPTSKVRVYLSPPSHPNHPTRPNKKAGAPSEGSARFLRLRHARQQGWSRQGRG